MDLLKKHAASLLDQSLECICIANLDGRFIALNTRWSQLFGWSDQELMSQPYLEFVHPDDISESAKKASSLSRGERIAHFRNRFSKKDGAYLWLDWHAWLGPDNLIFASATDVTNLMDDEILVQRAMDIARIGSWRVDTVEKTCTWSDVTYDIHDVARGTTISLEDGINYYVEEHRHIISGCVSDAVEFGKTWDVELKILTGTGKQRWVRAIGWPLHGPNGLLRLEGVFHDIDGRKRREFAMNEKHKELMSYQQALNMHSIIAVTDSRGVITHVNDKFCEISGYEKEELTGKTHAIVNSGYHDRDFFRQLWRTISSKKIWRNDIRNKNKSGGYYWVDTCISPILDQDGNIREYIAIRTEITDRKDFEKQLLEERQNTVQANRAKSQFLAAMSHEIRTPLNGILGLTQDLLLDTTGEQNEKLTLIRECGEGLLLIINDILDFSKIEANEISIKPVDCRLDVIINKVFRILQPKAREKHLYLHSGYKPEVPEWINIDDQKMGQVLFNLVGNAIKFTETGGITVSVTKVRKDLISITVSDTGPGIPQAFQRNLFLPFKQSESTVGDGGTGLGLSISRKLIQRMEGSLELLESKHGQTTFEIQLPIRPGKPVESSVLQPRLEQFQKLDEDISVLIAEDNSVNQKVLVNFLKRLGICSVVVVDNGEDAVTRAVAGDIDVVFMDINMPLLDGLKAASRIRSMGEKQPYIIALTAAVYRQDRENCIDAGMDDFVEKPLRMQSLMTALERFLGQRHKVSDSNAPSLPISPCSSGTITTRHS